MSKDFAIITGASSGIGYEFAKLIAKDNYNLILVARNKKKLEKIKKEIEKNHPIEVEVISLDLSIPKNALKLYEKTKNYNIEILINNAGFGLYGDFLKINLDEELNMINLNISALYILTKLFIKKMIKKNKGMVLNVASTAAFQPLPKLAVYSATKSFVLNFTLGIAAEKISKNIKISILAPGPTKTDFFNRAKMKNVNLLKLGMMSPEKVAYIGYKGLKKGKKLIIPGIINKLMFIGAKYFPMETVKKVVKKLM